VNSRTGKVIVTLLFLVALAFGVRDFFKLGAGLPWRTMDDFPDFYCGGWVLDRHADPYRYEPLRTCEHRFQAPGTYRSVLFANDPAIAIPAPQPPYDFLGFIGISRLPFGAARTADAIAIVGAAALCMLGLWMLGAPPLLAVAVFALSAAFVELNTGQIVPFALLALVWCGVALARGRDQVAGLLAAASLIEPSAGLPVVIAIACFVPRARAALCGGIIALGGMSLALFGVSGMVEYVARVLPAHSLSELHFPFQYSWTYAATWLGAPSNVARLVGFISYVAAAIVTIAIAPRTSSALERRELLVFLPALGAVVAGPFLHQEELCFAVPALTILAWRASPRWIYAAALCVLAVPWIALWSARPLFILAVLACIVIVVSVRVAARPAIVIVASIALALYALQLHPPHLPAPSPLTHTYAPAALVQDEWRDYAALRASSDPLWFYVKLPVWAALLAVIALRARRSRPTAGLLRPGNLDM
jgi:hypothetical protein